MQPERTAARVGIQRVRNNYLTRTESLRKACVLHAIQSDIVLVDAYDVCLWSKLQFERGERFAGP